MRNLLWVLAVVSSLIGLGLVEAAATPARAIVMPYKLTGNLDTQVDGEHQQRLKLADKMLRAGLQATGQYELVDEAEALAFSEKVISALNNNDCNHCEAEFAKPHNAKYIIAPYVFRLSQLVLTMHFVILDAGTGKPVLKKALDFRGDNDQSWQKAIDYFLKNVKKP
jgi:hypothetical protein